VVQINIQSTQGPLFFIFYIFLLATNFPKREDFTFENSEFPYALKTKQNKYNNNNNNNLKVCQTRLAFLLSNSQDELSNTPPGGLGHISSWSHSRLISAISLAHGKI